MKSINCLEVVVIKRYTYIKFIFAFAECASCILWDFSNVMYYRVMGLMEIDFMIK